MAATSNAAALEAFTRRASGPKTTLSLVLVAVAVASVSMSIDSVPRFSKNAFFAGLGLSIGLAIVVGNVAESLARRPSQRLVASLVMPVVFGAFIGMCVQAIVLGEVGGGWADQGGVKDLGGLVNTLSPIPWIASGIVLGGVPAFLVSLFLVVAARAIRRVTGHDARERFGVVFTGAAGLFAGLGLVFADRIAVAPLVAATGVSFATLLATLFIDGARIKLLERVYAGQVPDLEVVPKERFADDPSLLPLVSAARSDAVLVRVDRNASYRGSAAKPLALVAPEAHDTLRPLRSRQIATMGMLFVTGGTLLLFATAHAIVG